MAEMGGARKEREFDTFLSQRTQNRQIFDALATPGRVRRLFRNLWDDALEAEVPEGYTAEQAAEFRAMQRHVPASARTQARALLLGQILGRPSAAGSAEETVGANPLNNSEHVRKLAQQVLATGTEGGGKVIDFPPPGS